MPKKHVTCHAFGDNRRLHVVWQAESFDMISSELSWLRFTLYGSGFSLPSISLHCPCSADKANDITYIQTALGDLFERWCCYEVEIKIVSLILSSIYCQVTGAWLYGRYSGAHTREGFGRYQKPFYRPYWLFPSYICWPHGMIPLIWLQCGNDGSGIPAWIWARARYFGPGRARAGLSMCWRTIKPGIHVLGARLDWSYLQITISPRARL